MTLKKNFPCLRYLSCNLEFLLLQPIFGKYKYKPIRKSSLKIKILSYIERISHNFHLMSHMGPKRFEQKFRL